MQINREGRSKRHRSPLINEAEHSQVSSSLNSQQIFCNVLACLTKEQKTIVKEIGFASLLDLCCSYVPNELYCWLVDNFDADSKTLNLPNGFSFTLNEKCVHKLLGIPAGERKILGKGTAESFFYIGELVQCKGRTPSVQELSTMITPDLLGQSFARVFMLLALSSFLCPNTRGVCSSRYYLPLLDVSSISKLDWCSFTLEWLLTYIKKFKVSKTKKEVSNIGGCAMVLLISYLEFLSTPAFNFSLDIARLKVWSTTTVETFALLDSVPGTNHTFGNLQLKHICCTVFKDCFTAASLSYCLPDDVLYTIMNTYAPGSRDIVINHLSSLSSNLYGELAICRDDTSAGVISSYIENVLRVICSELSHGTNSFASPYCRGLTLSPDTDSESEDNDIVLKDDYLKRPKLIQGNSNSCGASLIDQNPSLDYFIKSFKLLPVPKLDSQDQCHDYIASFFQNLHSEFVDQPDCLGPGFPDSAELYQKLFLQLSDNEDSNMNCQLDVPLSIDLLSLAEESKQSTPRLLEKREDTKFIDDLLQSIEMKEMDVQNSYKVSDTYIYDDKGQVLFPMGFSHHGSSRSKEFVTCNQFINSEPSNARSDSSNHMNSSRNRKVIFSLDVEQIFYHLLTDNIIGYGSPRIFQYDDVWVDQKTLSLSMMPGGWINFHVMDAYCKMMSSKKPGPEQLRCTYFGHSTSAVLMTPLLNHNSYKPEFLEIVGLDLQKSLLVHIPCFHQNQWFLVTVNFDRKKFDILNPDYNADRIQSVANSVIYNFRMFFIRLFPTLQLFNIRDFSVHYIDVPKYNFRYDSGVFILQFLKTYNGIVVPNFSNADIPALREKFLFQLCFDSCNCSKAPILQDFRRNHGHYF